MARRVSRRSQEQILMQRWWLRVILALAFAGLAYGFVSLALDSAHLWEYALGVIFLWWAVHHAIRAVRYAFFS